MVQVSFLRREPTPEQLTVLDDLVPERDLVRVIGREWYWLPVEGVSTSKLPVSEIEKLLGEMTMRTLGTVERILARFGA